MVAVSTLEIEPEYLQILKYGKDNKHLYKHIESYLPRLEKVYFSEEKKKNANDILPIKTFVRRFSELQTDTLNSQVKIWCLLYASYKILGDTEKMGTTYERLQQNLPRVKSQATNEFIKLWVFKYKR